MASPGPGTQPHPDPGAHGLAQTQDSASPRPRGAWPLPGLAPSLTRIQGHTASPGPGIQLPPDPGTRGLSQTQGRVASPGSRVAWPRPDPGPSLTWIQGHTASPRPRIQLHPDPGAHGLTRTQGRVASPRPRTQPHPNPGAHGLARTRDLASPGPRGAWPHPDPGARGLSQTQGCVASPGSRGPRPHPDPGPSLTRIQGHTASPRPRIQLHPDPGALGLTRTQGCVASPGSRGPRPHPDPGPSLTRIQGHTASPGPGIQLPPDPGARGLTRTQVREASPGPGTQPLPDPGAYGLTRTRDTASPGPRGTVSLLMGTVSLLSPVPPGQTLILTLFSSTSLLLFPSFKYCPTQATKRSLECSLGEITRFRASHTCSRRGPWLWAKIQIPPSRCGSVAERHPMNQEVKIRFPVRAHARSHWLSWIFSGSSANFQFLVQNQPQKHAASPCGAQSTEEPRRNSFLEASISGGGVALSRESCPILLYSVLLHSPDQGFPQLSSLTLFKSGSPQGREATRRSGEGDAPITPLLLPLLAA
ncbi:hypothetical protein QTO34_007760 [Cnephaeus nilssonii]|uniref:Uncharacterized protein n=1 Tax=Cnephaeus nilssonii TaxID=3371016 RepID=A0AA40HIY1_CNENI|nr:hypothetical protein QTO34_007760 [Eptesicus nilssonii]